MYEVLGVHFVFTTYHLRRGAARSEQRAEEIVIHRWGPSHHYGSSPATSVRPGNRDRRDQTRSHRPVRAIEISHGKSRGPLWRRYRSTVPGCDVDNAQGFIATSCRNRNHRYRRHDSHDVSTPNLRSIHLHLFFECVWSFTVENTQTDRDLRPGFSLRKKMNERLEKSCERITIRLRGNYRYIGAYGHWSIWRYSSY